MEMTELGQPPSLTEGAGRRSGTGLVFRIGSLRGAELTIIVTAYVAAALLVYGTKSPSFALYWEDWWDQIRYQQSIEAFAHLDLAADRHWYPLGYALAVAPLSFLPTRLAMAVFSAVCFYGTWRGFRSVALRYGIGPWGAMGIFLLTTLAQAAFREQWVTPWTTTLSACLLWQAASRALRFNEQPEVHSALILGACLGAIVATRPTDLVLSAIISGYVLAVAVVQRRTGSVWPVAAAGGSVIAAYLILHYTIYGWSVTDYMRLSSEHGFDFSKLGWKAYVLLIEPWPWFPEGTGILGVCPWLMLGASGMLAALLPRQPRRAETALLALLAVVYCSFMFVYIDLIPPGLWRINNINYFKWLLPLFGLFVVIFVRCLKDRPVAAVSILAALVAVSSIRMVPVRAAPDEPARALLLPASEDEFVGFAEWGRVYMARSVIRDRKPGQLRNFYEYHQVQAPDGRTMAVALRRDFAGEEQWYGNADNDAYWPQLSLKNDWQANLPGPWPQAPLARYAPRISLGIPCWLPGYRCPRSLP